MVREVRNGGRLDEGHGRIRREIQDFLGSGDNSRG